MAAKNCYSNPEGICDFALKLRIIHCKLQASSAVAKFHSLGSLIVVHKMLQWYIAFLNFASAIPPIDFFYNGANAFFVTPESTRKDSSRSEVSILEPVVRAPAPFFLNYVAVSVTSIIIHSVGVLDFRT